MLIYVYRGDKELLREICCEGLYKQLIDRFESRPLSESAQWTLHEHIGVSRVVSSRASALPRKKSALRQVVVRIKSLQSLARLRRNSSGEEEVVNGTGIPKEMLEYLVLQRRIFDGKEGSWKVWGTTEETQVDGILGKVPQKRRSVGVAVT